MTARSEDEPGKPRRRITISPRLRITIAVTGGILAGLAWWGLAPGDDDDDDERGDRQTEQVEQFEDED